MRTILLVILILALLGALPWPYMRECPPSVQAGFPGGLLLLIILVLLLL